jgi:hypothetical protein
VFPVVYLFSAWPSTLPTLSGFWRADGFCEWLPVFYHDQTGVASFLHEYFALTSSFLVGNFSFAKTAVASGWGAV